MSNNPRHAGQGSDPDRSGDVGSGRTGETPASGADADQEPGAANPDRPGRVIGRARAPRTASPPPQATPEERVVIKDNRKINMMQGKASATPAPGGAGSATTATPGSAHAADGSADLAEQSSSAIYIGAAAAAARKAERAAHGAREDVPAAVREPDVGVAGTEETAEKAAGPLGAELAALRAELDERTGDVQRISAEYANYRKRIDRDRALVVEQATGHILAALLPVLDDIDRAREHGDLVGPFGLVADQLSAVLTKFGLTPFGTKGDPFDPTRHEAVSHATSAEVTEPTCVTVMRCGYLLGERLLRPALVAVADPE